MGIAHISVEGDDVVPHMFYSFGKVPCGRFGSKIINRKLGPSRAKARDMADPMPPLAPVRLARSECEFPRGENETTNRFVVVELLVISRSRVSLLECIIT